MTLIILPNTFGNATTNMAIDASLLYTLPKGMAIFRHYGWIEPTITFGYTQRIKEVRAVFPENLRFCRRLTGGGIVDHRNDWTYALVLQAENPAASAPPTKLYTTIHQCIQQALEHQLIKSQLAPCPRACKQSPSTQSSELNQCFLQPSANDVMHPNGTKIAGAAMKQTREGRLIQGSINRNTLPDNFNFNAFAKSFQHMLSDKLNMEIQAPEDLRGLFNETHIQKERERFESVTWQTKR